jgi:hypothetical protein
MRRPGLTIGLVVASAALVSGADEDTARRLELAASRGDAPQIAALLAGGARADARDGEGRPLVVRAAEAASPKAVEALLRGGADPDRADRSGWTALHEAARRGDLDTARVLLDAGAHPDPRSRDRGTPLDVAERAGHGDVAKALRMGGARGSGKSIGDTVCVRPWRGDGYCAIVEGVDQTRVRLRLTSLFGCQGSCPADAACSAGRAIGGRDGLAPGDVLAVPASCLTHTGVSARP